MDKQKTFNNISQIAIPLFTILAQLLTSLKHPEIGLILNLIAQPFWLYSSRKAYKEAGQIGLLVTTILFIIITGYGVINYWLF